MSTGMMKFNTLSKEQVCKKRWKITRGREILQIVAEYDEEK
jgi:hypothetical protein